MYLGSALRRTSNGLPGSGSEAGRLILPYLAFLRAGFAGHPPHGGRGELLPHHFTLTLRAPCGALRAVSFCCTFPGIAPGSR